MRELSARDKFFQLRTRMRLALAQNCVDNNKINLGGLRQFCQVQILLPLHKELSGIDHVKFNNVLFSQFSTSTSLIYVDLNLVGIAKDFLQSIQGSFFGTYILDTRDESIQDRPSWISPKARWAAPHIPIPRESTGILIPVGVEEARRAKHNFPWLFKDNSNKLSKVMVGPFGSTHRVRLQLSNLATAKSVDVYHSRMSPLRYARIASHYKFVFCPRGNGIDTHRVWESLYRGSVPVLIQTPWSSFLRELGLPLFLIDKVEDLYEISPETFSKFYQSFMDERERYDRLLTNEYWINHILRI